MNYLTINIKKKKELLNLGSFLFFSGVFFIPSSLFIGIIFLLPASILGSFLQNKSFFKDKWNYPFIVFGIIILTNSILQNFVLINYYEEVWDPILSIIGLGNWIPFLYFFWAFQPYLDSTEKRRTLGIILITGSVPVLVSGFGQYFLNWTGPFTALNGLIIWYQKPIEAPAGLSGLFSNQNYTGSWLSFVWPFCIALILEKKNGLIENFVAFCFLISVGFASFLTYSRNAWLGLLVSIPFVLEHKGRKFFLFTIIFLIFIFCLIYSPIFIGEIQHEIKNILPQKFLLEFTEDGYQDLDVTRMEIYLSTISLIKTNPIFGIGGASFSAIYFLETTFWKGHSHNLLLELAVSYGLPASIIFFLIITYILFKSGKLIFFRKSFDNIFLFDRAIWASLFFSYYHN